MPSPDQSEARNTDSGFAGSGTHGPGMASGLPLGSIEELAEELRARSVSNDEGEGLTLLSGGDISATSDDGDISPVSSRSSSSSSSSECEGEWEDEWNSFQAAYDDHVQSFWTNRDAFYFDNPALGGTSSVHDSDVPVFDTGHEPEYLNDAELTPNTGACLNTSTYTNPLSIDIADQKADQEQTLADTLLPTIIPFPPRSPSKRKRTGKQPRDGALQMRIRALWNLHQHNESLARTARINAAETNEIS
ncbi:hypothetical protein PV04_02322 [Phialophora macrospora]|uniref:Uncharacterized protein n=1 Tax=Phialophora macrospora TaxID=1851006 RepID=A0A0D2CXY5_9EURO|nr:hypothetical protein PV04_02322 [Phialophora macrospora]